eukprot:scaffold61865_cov48-Phaeocystis_antarctica.AAC.1
MPNGSMSASRHTEPFGWTITRFWGAVHSSSPAGNGTNGSRVITGKYGFITKGVNVHAARRLNVKAVTLINARLHTTRAAPTVPPREVTGVAYRRATQANKHYPTPNERSGGLQRLDARGVSIQHVAFTHPRCSPSLFSPLLASRGQPRRLCRVPSSTRRLRYCPGQAHGRARHFQCGEGTEATGGVRVEVKQATGRRRCERVVRTEAARAAEDGLRVGGDSLRGGRGVTAEEGREVGHVMRATQQPCLVGAAAQQQTLHKLPLPRQQLQERLQVGHIVAARAAVAERRSVAKLKVDARTHSAPHASALEREGSALAGGE